MSLILPGHLHEFRSHLTLSIFSQLKLERCHMCITCVTDFCIIHMIYTYKTHKNTIHVLYVWHNWPWKIFGEGRGVYLKPQINIFCYHLPISILWTYATVRYFPIPAIICSINACWQFFTAHAVLFWKETTMSVKKVKHHAHYKPSCNWQRQICKLFTNHTSQFATMAISACLSKNQYFLNLISEGRVGVENNAPI